MCIIHNKTVPQRSVFLISHLAFIVHFKCMILIYRRPPGMTPEARSEALNAIPLRRFGQASEIADAALFLATNQYANNCVLNLDGGLSAV